MPTAADIYYFYHASESRSKPPVILIHGAGGNHLNWPPEMRRIAGCHAYALDLPGHGKSGGIGRQSIPDYTRCLLQFMDNVMLSRAVIIGHSMGGAIALELALNHPGRVAGLCLVSSGARLRVADILLDNSKNPATIPLVIQAMREWAFSPHADARLKELASRRFAETRPAVLSGDFLACNNFDVRTRLQEIRTPTLILAGSDDRMTPPAFSDFLAANIPGAQLKLVDGAGHMLMLEKPRLTADALTGFLAQLPYTSGH